MSKKILYEQYLTSQQNIFVKHKATAVANPPEEESGEPEESPDEKGEITISKEEFGKLKEQQEKLEKMSMKYKDMERTKNQLLSSQTMLAQAGLIKIEDGKIIPNENIYVKKPESESKISTIDQINSSIQQLKEKYDNGDIDSEAYHEKMIDLKVERRAQMARDEFAREQASIREETEKQKKQQQTQTEEQKWREKTLAEFPDAINESSEFYKAMQEIHKESPELWSNNIKDIYKIAILAKEKMIANGKYKEAKASAITNKFATLPSTQYSGGDNSTYRQKLTETISNLQRFANHEGIKLTDKKIINRLQSAIDKSTLADGRLGQIYLDV